MSREQKSKARTALQLQNLSKALAELDAEGAEIISVDLQPTDPVIRIATGAVTENMKGKLIRERVDGAFKLFTFLHHRDGYSVEFTVWQRITRQRPKTIRCWAEEASA